VPSTDLRETLARFQDWDEAHLTLSGALDGLPVEHRGVRPPGSSHSIWELLEHIRIAQRDLLEFCTAERYEHPAWPDGYWPPTVAPPHDGAWRRSVVQIRDDRAKMQRLAQDESIDLLAPARHATEPHQTVLRALLLSQDHLSYHVGQIVLARQLLRRS
jgi:hypothetical protein